MELNRRECFVHTQNTEVLAPIITNGILENFFAGIDRNDDKDYEASLLEAMQSLIDRYLHESNHEYSILNFKKIA